MEAATKLKVQLDPNDKSVWEKTVLDYCEYFKN